jgi:hypothetical protein
VSRRVELEDEDGVDGPFEDAIDRARRQDDRRARAYAAKMAAYRAALAALAAGRRAGGGGSVR